MTLIGGVNTYLSVPKGQDLIKFFNYFLSVHFIFIFNSKLNQLIN